MTDIILFHSVVGLRPLELEIAARLRAAGHTVATPDLNDGRAAISADAGFTLMAEYSGPELTNRARAALAILPDTAVLAGVSMGAGMVGEL
jgi:dienelactone hydrolase